MRKLNRISVSDYTESFYNFFASTGINRNWLQRDKDGEFETTYISSWRLLLFILLRINVYSKILYLLLLFQGYVHSDTELDFFTKIGIIIWLVTTTVALYSDYYYMSKYPCFEALSSFWNIQSEIFQMLSLERREEFRKRLQNGAVFRTIFHCIMSSIAMTGLGVQIVMDPKGIMFTGSLIEGEPFICTVLLGLLEEFFLYATWMQAVSVILVNVLAYRELTVVFQVLTDELTDLRRRPVWKRDVGSSGGFSDYSRYTIDLLFLEYRKLEIISEQMRKIMSPVLLSTIIIYFGQISSDVFVGIRLMRLDAYMDVGFFAADCCCGMLYWFVSLNSLSKVDGAFEEFHEAFKGYFIKEYGGRLLHRKRYKSLRNISVWIGPSAMTRVTVGTAMMELVNYYILAAMW